MALLLHRQGSLSSRHRSSKVKCDIHSPKDCDLWDRCAYLWLERLGTAYYPNTNGCRTWVLRHHQGVGRWPQTSKLRVGFLFPLCMMGTSKFWPKQLLIPKFRRDLGSEVTGLSVGARVTGEGHITCGFCRNCRAGRRHLCRETYGVGVNRPGAFAEYLCLPAYNVFQLSKTVSDDVASFMDALGNATHTALSFNLVGEDVLITGAGPIGVMAAAICRHVGARHIVVTDINDYRLDLALKCGASRALNVSSGDATQKLQKVMKELNMTEGFDIGLEMSGVPSAVHSMLETMNVGANVALLGIPSGPFPINWDHVVFKGLVIKGIYGREMFETWYKMQQSWHSSERGAWVE